MKNTGLARPARIERAVVLLFALERESSALRRRLGRGVCFSTSRFRAYCYDQLAVPLLLVETGVGAARTGAALDALCATVSPVLIMSCGYSGALQTHLNVGDVVIATEVSTTAHTPAFPCGPAWGKLLACRPGKLAACPTHAGRIVCAPSMICQPEQKRQLGCDHDALAVDMESAAAAEFCVRRRLPFAAIRVISDTADRALSPQLATLLSGGQAPLGKILLALLLYPRLLPEMLRLAADTALASERLANALQALLPNACRNMLSNSSR